MKMTKEEFIDKAIECRKKGKKTVDECFCKNIGGCGVCPASLEGCKLMLLLLDEIIRLREEKLERKETNLEHYFKRTTFKMTRDKVVLESDYAGDGVEDVFMKINGNTVQWLLEAYEEPKYQVSQFEYDLIKSCKESSYGNWRIEDFAFLRPLRSVGYFKNIPTDTRIRDILENAEVVEQ